MEALGIFLPRSSIFFVMFFFLHLLEQTTLARYIISILGLGRISGIAGLSGRIFHFAEYAAELSGRIFY